jgi:hypothetical protein
MVFVPLFYKLNPSSTNIEISNPSAISPCSPIKKVTVNNETNATYKIPVILLYPAYDFTLKILMNVTMLMIRKCAVRRYV